MKTRSADERLRLGPGAEGPRWAGGRPCLVFPALCIPIPTQFTFRKRRQQFLVRLVLWGELQRAYKVQSTSDRAGRSDKESIMRRPLLALAVVGSLAAATVAAPTQAHAQWRGWGWGLGLGILAGAAIASSAYAWGYPGYYGYGYPGYAYGYGYPAYGYGYGYPAYASYGYGYPAYSYGYPGYAYSSYAYGGPYYGGVGYGGYRPYVRRAWAYGGYRVARRAAIYRARWR
jgi:hypothetical protein